MPARLATGDSATDARFPVRVRARRVARLATAAALVLFAGARPAGAAVGRVTEPVPEVSRDTLFAGGLPSPAEAQRRSAMATLVPLALGSGLVVGDVASGGSGGLAVAGVVLGAAGVIAGPSSGYAYAGLHGRAAAGAGLRLGLVLALPVAAAAAIEDRGGDEAAWAALFAFVGGSAVAVISAAYDVATVGHAVERANARRAVAPRVSLGPARAPFSRAPGLAVRVPLGAGAR